MRLSFWGLNLFLLPMHRHNSLTCSCIHTHTLPQSRELVDTAILQEQEIKNDVVLYMVFRDEGGDGWEDIEVANGGASSAEMKS